jgi:lipopolysaccharide export system permease protein
MKKIDKLVLKAFWGPFFLSLAVVIFIFLIRLILMYFNDLFGKDLGINIYLELFFYLSLVTLPIAMPLAMLLSTLMTYGKLGEFFELTALKSAGISMIRAIMPTLVAAILITSFTFWFNNVGLPWANLKFYSLLYDIKSTKTTLNIKEGIFYSELPGYSIKVGKKFPDNKTLKDVIIFDHTKNDGNKHVTLADSAQMYTIMNKQYLVFELFNGYDYAEDADRSSGNDATDMAAHGFKKSKMVMSLSVFDMHKTDEEQFKHHQIMMNVIELTHTSDSLNVEYKKMMESNFITARSYYIYHLRNIPKKMDSKQKNLFSNVKWIAPLIKKKASLHANDHIPRSEYATNQIRNMVAYSETNESSAYSKKKDYRLSNLEWHHKFSSAFAVFVMFLIGAPLGAIIRKGGFGLPVVIGVFFFILMYVLTQQGDKLVKEGKTFVLLGAWASNIILVFIGGYFMKNAINDSRLFDSDLYNVLLSRAKDYLSKTTMGSKLLAKNR